MFYSNLGRKYKIKINGNRRGLKRKKGRKKKGCYCDRNIVSLLQNYKDDLVFLQNEMLNTLNNS